MPTSENWRNYLPPNWIRILTKREIEILDTLQEIFHDHSPSNPGLIKFIILESRREGLTTHREAMDLAKKMISMGSWKE